MSRADGRRANELRPLEQTPDFLEQPHGCVLWEQGKTIVLCTATIDDGVPRWMSGKGVGWMTAEYSLLPASTGDRTAREARTGRQQGRTVEIQRLIGRALRAVCDFEALGERTLWLDCDVLQADGGTRCAAISGAYVAARRALDRFGLAKVFRDSVAAVSVGVVAGESLLDLDYSEDSTADVDLNVVMTGDGRLVEVQATAERDPFSREQLDELLELADARDRPDRRGAGPGHRGCALTTLVLCSHNENKRRELEAALPGFAVELLDADDYPAETGDTFLENARGKALYGREVGPAGSWLLGEDSGLEVDALGGAPGVADRALGARAGTWSGSSRRWPARTTAAPATSASSSRSHRTAASCARPGRSQGTIAEEPRGTAGFGFDPVFVPDGEEQTVAELGDAWKAEHSHRARAAQALLTQLG